MVASSNCFAGWSNCDNLISAGWGVLAASYVLGTGGQVDVDDHASGVMGPAGTAEKYYRINVRMK
ncbi:MAG: hypothetical protein C0404_06520 [Verrucomicrobia bacterium]|nr:hypothetical protein [Verrucomicrobiota bacterium]